MMADSILQQWTAVFEAKGLDGLMVAVKDLQAETLKASEAHERYARAAADPAFRKSAEAVESLRRHTASLRDIEARRFDLSVRQRALRTGAYAEEVRGLQAVAREQAKVAQLERAQQIRGRHAAVASGAYAAGLRPQMANDAAERRAAALEERARIAAQREQVAGGQFGRQHADETFNSRARAELERQREMVRLAQRRGDVASGAYAREERAARSLYREQEKVAQLERRAVLNGKYGRFGGAAAAFAESRGGQAIHHGVAAGVAIGGGVVRSGMGQTVEMERYMLEFRLAARELAASFKPALTAATKATQTFRQRLEKFSPDQQDMVMGAGVLGVGGLLAHGLLKRAGAPGLGTVGARAGLAFAGGGGMFGALGAAGIGAVARDQGVGEYALGGAAAFGAGRAWMAGKSLLRGAGRAVAPVAIGMAGYDAAFGGYYTANRADGRNKLVSGLAAVKGGVQDLFSLGTHGEEFRKKYADQLKPKEDRRQLMKADAGFDEIGSSYIRLSESLALRDPLEGSGSAKKFDDLVGEIRNLVDVLKKSDKASDRVPLERGG